MNHKNRVIKTFNHQEPDRVPICIGGTAQKFSNSIYLEIKKRLDVDDTFKDDSLLDELGNVIYYHPKILEYFDSDFRHIQINRIPNEYNSQNDTDIHELGFELKNSSKSEIASIVSNPLRGASISEISNYDWPDPEDKKRFKGLKEKAKKLAEETEYAIASYKATLFGIFDLACAMRGMDQFLIDLITDKKLAETLLDKIYEFNFRVYEGLLDEVGQYLDLVEFNDDLGTQNNLIISPEMYRKHVKPIHRKMVEMFKMKAKNAKVFLHCCGSVYDIIPDFIEIGIDVLNPIQPLADKMDSSRLKKEFGKDISFQGGIDLQYALSGSISDIEKEVKERIKSLAPGGGYVLSTANNLTKDIPLENIFRLYEIAKEYGKYPIEL